MSDVNRSVNDYVSNSELKLVVQRVACAAHRATCGLRNDVRTDSSDADARSLVGDPLSGINESLR